MSIQPADVARFLDRSGWSQARLAWTLGINQPRISRFVNGLKKPNGPTQDALDAFFARDPLARSLAAGRAGSAQRIPRAASPRSDDIAGDRLAP